MQRMVNIFTILFFICNITVINTITSNNKENKMTLIFVDSLSKYIVESGVKKAIKRITTNSSGEAKYHLGPSSEAPKYNDFFNNFAPTNVYIVQKENILSFLQAVKFEYIYEVFQKYHSVSLTDWKEKYEFASKLPNTTSIDLRPFIDSRYYITSDSSFFKNFLRGINLPYITLMTINKYQDSSTGDYTYQIDFDLNTEIELPPVPPSGIYSREVDAPPSTIGKNQIIFGAPGTGKSYYLNQKYNNNVSRVTFHPEYTHYDFIGSYKPIPIYKEASSSNINESDGTTFSKGEPLIDYRFVPGPFTLSLAKALSNEDEMYTLIIEELNRANAAAVFGDLFQLLDRDDDGNSIYSVSNIEVSSYLDSIDVNWSKENREIYIPSNLNIVATMNSADQGVFFMDSAFKRRWQFKYLPINFAEALHRDEVIPYNNQSITWSDFVTQINKKLSSIEIGVAEDKLIGPYFLKPGDLKNKSVEEKKEIIASKLFIYLWDDVVKLKRGLLFKSPTTYSNLIERYLQGESVLNIDFSIITSQSSTSLSGDTTSANLSNAIDPIDSSELDVSESNSTSEDVSGESPDE